MSDLLTYHAWNIAAVRFSSPPDALTEKQARSLEEEIERAITLETGILATSEAQRISVPSECIQDAAKAWRGENPDCPISDLSLHDAIGRELKVQALLDAIALTAPQADAQAARAFFDANPNRFCKPERRDVRHILITVNADYEENTETAARSRIENLVQELKEGATFSELAARHSECPTAMQGGLVGTVAKDSLYPEVGAAAFALDEGNWGGPVRTDLGWHLVLCEAIHPEETVTYENAEPKILDHLQQQARRLAQINWLKQLDKKSAA